MDSIFSVKLRKKIYCQKQKASAVSLYAQCCKTIFGATMQFKVGLKSAHGVVFIFFSFSASNLYGSMYLKIYSSQIKNAILQRTLLCKLFFNNVQSFFPGKGVGWKAYEFWDCIILRLSIIRSLMVLLNGVKSNIYVEHVHSGHLI